MAGVAKPHWPTHWDWGPDKVMADEKLIGKAKRVRPTGLAPEKYKGHERWSGRRWAWEFLRRHHEFQERCHRVASHPTPEKYKSLVCGRFGLRRYKPYWESYSGPGVFKPRYRATHILRARCVTDKEIANRNKLHLGLTPGQVAIKFDLRYGGSMAIDAQLSDARIVLRRAGVKWQVTSGKRQREPRVKVELLPLLRLLDLVDYVSHLKKTGEKVPPAFATRSAQYKLLFGDDEGEGVMLRGANDADLSKKFSAKYAIAKRYAGLDYAVLAIRDQCKRRIRREPKS